MLLSPACVLARAYGNAPVLPNAAPNKAALQGKKRRKMA